MHKRLSYLSYGDSSIIRAIIPARTFCHMAIAAVKAVLASIKRLRFQA
jgi:hypothetical protein